MSNGSSFKKFKLLAGDDKLWQRLFSNNWSVSPAKVEFDWKNTFKNKAILLNNWQRGKYTTKILEGHQKAIRCLQMNDEYLLSGASDKMVKVYDSKSGQCLRTLSGPNSGVLAVEFTGDSTATVGYRNGVIRTWDFQNGSCLSEKQFNYWSEGFHFIGTCLVSWDSTLDIWDFDSGVRKTSFTDHTKKLSCVELSPGKKFAASGSADKMVIRYDLESSKVTHKLNGHTATINALCLDENIVVSASNDRLINVWDIRANGNCAATLKGHVYPARCLAMDDFKIVSGAADNTIRIWDIRKYECIQKLEQHTSPVLCVQMDAKRLVSGGNDGSIIIWNYGKI